LARHDAAEGGEAIVFREAGRGISCISLSRGFVAMAQGLGVQKPELNAIFANECWIGGL
jgi:hypothetical protein